MNPPLTLSGDQLAAALQALGVNFLLGHRSPDEHLHTQPPRLLAALAQSPEARLRLALIPLLLEYPTFAAAVPAVSDRLAPPARLTLQCYYSAAVWLQQKHWPRLEALGRAPSPLPDYFSRTLAVCVTPDPDRNLEQLAQRHQALSGTHVNWLGTYHHAAQIWLKNLAGRPT